MAAIQFPIVGQDAYVQTKGEPYKRLPSIYQIELTAACDLACPTCLRSTHLRRQPRLFPFELLEIMYKRGDFEGSSYVELQQAGEPTLHPGLRSFIRYMQRSIGLMVGLSTHGLNMRRSREGSNVTEDLLLLDALTISIDSVDPDLYHEMRYPAKLGDLLASLHYFFSACATCRQYKRLPLIELQLVCTDSVEGSGNVEALARLMRERGWDRLATIRTVQDSFAVMQGRRRATVPIQAGFCLNPFTSVSITQDGDVVSCCYIFEPDRESVNYYGNLHEQSLREIWEGPRVREMQELMRLGVLRDQCVLCTSYSPVLIHDNIVSRLVRLRKGV